MLELLAHLPTDLGVQYGSVSSSVLMQMCSKGLQKLLKGLFVVAFISDNDLL